MRKLSLVPVNARLHSTHCYVCKGATRKGAKGAEAPSLSQVKVKRKDKYQKVLIFLSLNDLKLLIWPIYDLKN